MKGWGGHLVENVGPEAILQNKTCYCKTNHEITHCWGGQAPLALKLGGGPLAPPVPTPLLNGLHFIYAHAALTYEAYDMYRLHLLINDEFTRKLFEKSVQCTCSSYNNYTQYQEHMSRWSILLCIHSQIQRCPISLFGVW